MNDTNSHSSSLQLLRLLGEGGHRLFTPENARELLPQASTGYVNQLLHSLVKLGWLIRVRRGLYALSPTVFQGAPLHELELAMVLARPAAISHWSALSVHGLTEQVPQEVVVLTTDQANPTRSRSGDLLSLCGFRFRFCRVKPEFFFGVETHWRGDVAIEVTDPERTLLDGLLRPQLCGDFGVVLEAFERHRGRLRKDRIIDYARRLGVTCVKRLGWMLEQIGSPAPELENDPIRGYRPLDPTGPRLGRCNSRWNMIENLPGLSRP